MPAKGKGSAKGSGKGPKASNSTLYILAASANSHGSLCLIKENKLQYDIKVLDAMKGETRAPEFVAKNPFHCCPSLEDGSLFMWESHAVLRYLSNKHGLDQWYPQSDVDARGKVDQILDWRHCDLYPNVAKCCYAPLGFGPPDAAKEKEGVEGVKANLDMMAKHYLKTGKFLGENAKPTIADLSVRPCLAFLKVIDYKFPKPIQEYIARFDAAVAAYAEVAAPLEQYLAYLASQKGTKGSKKGSKKENAKGSSKAAAKEAPKKADAKKAAVDKDGLDDKRVKACLKEGGKKGQDLCGMSTFGCHYFCTAMEEPKGELVYLKKCMEGANADVDPEAEDRKGGANDLGKVFFSASDTNMCMLCHFPKEVEDKASMKEWFGAICDSVGAKMHVIDAHNAWAEVAGDPDANKFPLKMRDAAVGAGYGWLRKRGLVLDDDSEDDINYADSAGVDLNSGPKKDDGYGDY